MLRKVKGVLAFPKFSGVISVVHKAIIKQNRKNVSPKYGAISPRHGIPPPVPIQNVSINTAVPASPHKHLLELQQSVLVNISHSSCTCNGDHVGLLIKTGSI